MTPAPREGPISLSIVIPAYNEEAFLDTLLDQIVAVDLAPLDVAREIIVVDDGSTDRTAAIAERRSEVRLIRQGRNQGKGAAVRTGIRGATGDYVLIQDADLEYEPRDYIPLLQALRGGTADVVYGSRYLRHPDAGALRNAFAGPWPGQSWFAYLGGQSLSLVCLASTGRYLTDTVTALKLFPRSFLVSQQFETSGFELDHELTAKALWQGLRIVEVPIHYMPRSREQGKKIGAKDWWRGTRTFWKYRKG